MTIKTVLTTIGRAKILNAITLGETFSITKMALGDGVIVPIESMAALSHEVWRGVLDSLVIDPENADNIVARVTVPDEVGGWTVRECGLYDSNDFLIAIGNVAEVEKVTGYVSLTVTMVVAIGSIDISGITLTPAGPYIHFSEKGMPGGVATVDSEGMLVQGIDAGKISGVIAAENLPSYVDDIIERADYPTMIATDGESGKIYITLDDNHHFRWTGSAYVDITGGLSPIAAATILANLTAGTAVPTANSLPDIRDALAELVSVWTFAGEVRAYGGSRTHQLQMLNPGDNASAAVITAQAGSNEYLNTRGTNNSSSVAQLEYRSDRTILSLQSSGGSVSFDTYGQLFGNATYGLTIGGSYAGGQGMVLSPSGTITKYSGVLHFGTSGSYINTAHIGEVFTYAVYQDWGGYYAPASGDTLALYETYVRITPAANLAALTLSMMGGASAPQGKSINIYFSKDIASLSYTAAAPYSAFLGCPSSVSAGDSITITLINGYWQCTASSLSNAVKSMTHDASGGGTLIVPSGIRSLKLTGALPAAFTTDCSALPDGQELVIYSVNGVTALTISGGANMGTLNTLAAAGIGRVKRCSNELIVQ